MSERMRVAAVQTVAGGDVAANLAQAERAGGGRGGGGRAAHRAAGILRHPRCARHRQAGGERSATAADRSRTSSPRMAREHRAYRRRRQRADGHATTRRGCAARAWSTVPTARASRATTRSTCSDSRKGAEDYDETRTIEPGERHRRVRRALRPRRPVDLLRRALSGALSRARRLRAAAGACRVHRDDRRRALGAAAARARRREPVLRAGGRAGRACIRMAGAPGVIRCSSIRGGWSSRRSRTTGRASSSGDVDPAASRKSARNCRRSTHRVM